MKKIRIEITSTVEDMDEAGLTVSSDKTHSTAEGTASLYDGELRISYTESDENGRTDSLIVISKDKTQVKRTGAVEYDFLFLEGKNTSALYSVPPYSFDTEIYTRRIRSDFNGCTGRLTLIYDMTIGGAKKKTRMNIGVSEI